MTSENLKRKLEVEMQNFKVLVAYLINIGDSNVLFINNIYSNVLYLKLLLKFKTYFCI